MTAEPRIALPSAIDAQAVAMRDPAAPVVTLAGTTMGTAWQVRFVCPVRVDPDAIARAIVARLEGLVAEMSHWDAGSQLCRFNRAVAGTWLPLPPDFANVMAAALTIAAASDNAFDPAIGRLVDLWGFGPPGSRPSPDDAALAAARAVSGWQHLRFDPGQRRLRQPGGVALDLSGIAKGHAVDAVAGLLAAHGIAHALVEIGGELAGRGVQPDGEPWWVDIEQPPGIAAAPIRVALHGLAIATSGDYRRGGHTIDPRTGRPATSGVVSASVIAATAMAADAWASVLAVLGPPGLVIADRHGLAARLLVRRADGGCDEHLSAGMTAMIEGD